MSDGLTLGGEDCAGGNDCVGERVTRFQPVALHFFGDHNPR